MVGLTMNPTVQTMAAGDLATRWHRFVEVVIVQTMEAAMHLRMLIDPRLPPARCLLFRRMVVAAAVVVVAATSDVKSFANSARSC